ncbi:phosphatidylserine decarboxylase [Thermosyntropha lipolytica DSM 11003]|uniref:Phosphatidylserine decarboxylase proenzyme n=1 Tax=Thermosyntropha lipolytica DSM 11003 TaxID=1123382 RepID=A0A1M5RFC2_9FIRM|nr:phosphatidylserine decarboxylase family protein [Thermosyntropha lipolytica]SHH24830.1 phosphatidylserine decarboxylase [Thermosyntropha lipolytica DSM 11003]
MRIRYIAVEGLPFIIFFALAVVIVWLTAGFYWAVLPLVLLFFCLFFFRDPERDYVFKENIVVSPADGVVMSVAEVYEGRFIKDKAVKISIFLSLFDVHVNRIPVSGKVVELKNEGGLFLPAYKKEAGDLNVRSYTVLETRWGKVVVAQITGLVARRIVNRAKVGDVFKTGERFGLIRFGSCTEVYLPCTARILVKEGQKVRGGETVIAEFCD